MNNVIIIPARIGSKRFPNKLLQPFGKTTVIEKIISTTKRIKKQNPSIKKIIIATPDSELISIGQQNNIECFFMKGMDTWCGSQRAYLYYKNINSNFDNYITLPADEILLLSNEVSKIISEYNEYSYLQNKADLYTCYCDFLYQEDLLSSSSCKIISDIYGEAIYFSRQIIPSSKESSLYPLSLYKKHVGIFIFPNNFMKNSETTWDITDNKNSLAHLDGLEQNRFIEMRHRVGLLKIKHYGFGLDRPEDLEKLEQRFKELELYKKL